MTTSTNVALQLSALITTIMVRLIDPGWMVIIAVLTIIPLIIIALPLVLALATRRRGRLQRGVAVPFVAAAVALVALAYLHPETDDQDDWVPLAKLFGLPSDHTILGDPYTVGNVALLAYLATLVWTGIAIVATSRIASPRHRPGAVTAPR